MPTNNKHLSRPTDLDTVLDAFNALKIAFAIKNAELEYVHFNEKFLTIVGNPDQFQNDFDLFIPEVAYELGHEESKLLISEKNQEIERMIITKSGEKKIVQIQRAVFYSKTTQAPFISVLMEDVTQKTQDKQFDAFKKVLSTDDVLEKVLNQFSNHIFRSTNKKSLFDGVCKLAISLLKLEDTAIYTLDESNLLQLQAVARKKGSRAKDKQENQVLKPGEGICSLVAKSKESFMANNLDLEPIYKPGAFKARSELCLPITYQKNVLGVIDSESSQYNFFTKSHLKQLESVASMLAIKINELNYRNKLEKRENILRAFINQSPVHVALLDPDFQIVIASDSWKLAFLETDDNVNGKNLIQLNPHFSQSDVRKMQKVLQGKAWSFTHREYITPSGKKMRLSGKHSPWRENEEIIGIVSYVIDQTEEYERIRELDQSQDDLMEAESHGNINNWSFNPKSGLFKWGSGMLGLKLMKFGEDMPFEKIFDLIPDGYRQEFARAIDTAMKDKSTFDLIHPIIDEDRTIWLHNKGKVHCEDDEITMVKGRARDITSEMDAENALREKVEELEKVNTQLDQFVYKTAHDLRAPLTNVSALINVMKNVNDLELMRTYLDLQESSILKLDNFILNIATFTKNVRLPLHVEQLNVHGVIDDVLNDYLYVSNSEKVQKIVSVNREVSYYSDKIRFITILRNLIDNSIRFADLTKEKPILKIDVTIERGLIVMTVVDNGIGISDKVINKVTDMFFRGTNVSEGAGIGLYIVKETVQKLKGNINISSRAGEETVVKVELPNLSITDE